MITHDTTIVAIADLLPEKANARKEAQWFVNTVLFVCYNNAGRSLMAEAFFNAGAEQRGLEAKAESAGLLGVGAVNSMVLRCLQQVDIPVENLKPKQVTEELVAWAETIIGFQNLGSERTAVKFTVAEDWSVPDCAGMAYGRLCEVRDDIRTKVEDLLDRMATAATS